MTVDTVTVCSIALAHAHLAALAHWTTKFIDESFLSFVGNEKRNIKVVKIA